MAEQRLPYVDGDDGIWGEVLNQFLEKEHFDIGSDNPANGGHKTVTIRPGASTPGGAPLKFFSGALLSNPEAGAVEFQSDKLYFTQSTGPTRKTIAAYNDSAGATGDVYYRDASGNFVRLGIGNNGEVLTVTSGLPAWEATGGGGGNARTVQTVNSATTAGNTAGTDYVYYVSGTTTITLPTAIGNTSKYTIKNIGLAPVSIVTSSSQLIDGKPAPLVLQYTHSSVDILSDDSNWRIQ